MGPKMQAVAYFLCCENYEAALSTSTHDLLVIFSQNFKIY